MLKALRVVAPLTIALSVMIAVAGCGEIPSISQPAQATARPSDGPAQGPAGAAATVPAVQSPPPLPSPTPSPSPSPTPVPPNTVKFGTTSSLGGWVLDVADKQGFLASQRIVLDRKETDPGSTAAAEDVEKRDREVGVVSTDRLVQVGKNGQSLVMVAGLVNKAAYTLIAARDVPDMKALKGKLIGHLDEKGISAAILRRLLKSQNFSDNDIKLFVFPDMGVVGAAVANGTVGASLVDPPRSGRLRVSGFKPLLNTADIIKDFQAEGLVVRPDWARQNEDVLTRLIRATVLAERWIGNSANKDAAIKIMQQSLGLGEIEAKVVYEQYVDALGSIPKEGDIDQAGVRAVIELLGEIDAAGTPRPDPARLTDTTYLQRARSSLPR